MIGSIFPNFSLMVNGIVSSVASGTWNVSGTHYLYAKIISLNGNISPILPVENTEITLTLYDKSKKGSDGRIAGIDNYHKDMPLHQHLNGSMAFMSGNYTLGTLGSHAFLEFFPIALPRG